MIKLKINLYNFLIFAIRVLVCFNIINSILTKNYYFLLIGIVTLFLTFLPKILGRLLKKECNKILSFSIIFFVFISLYLGTLKNFYRYTWWDTMLHIFSGVILGVIALIIIDNFNKCTDSKNLILNPIFVLIFIISFATFCGVIWEIYEFAIDNLVGLDMQGVKFSGVSDTMVDLIADLLGSIIPGVYGYIIFKKRM
ncbi:hypothetical protein CLOACE_13020 [Clostridium acetireducens DSM 10703]|jgi:hypothetical protein|uniref:Membrane-spanning protein n=1 Tax=Clostridium acetireducens DSM 10703 TaxID=1121290 RepID=A0A1E8EYJ5_9CLOT|nr:hypothetical protein [Clostridium acetireducens]OFI06047.1 hypothetical protein CLOACE_13020 [Clostridium acetireducens DSM 10703]